MTSKNVQNKIYGPSKPGSIEFTTEMIRQIYFIKQYIDSKIGNHKKLRFDILNFQ